jgi:hypothetical protein
MLPNSCAINSKTMLELLVELRFTQKVARGKSINIEDKHVLLIFNPLEQVTR